MIGLEEIHFTINGALAIAFGGLVFRAGAIMSKLAESEKKLTTIVAHVEKVPIIETRLQTLENVVDHHVRSDHRELRADMRDLRQPNGKDQ